MLYVAATDRNVYLFYWKIISNGKSTDSSIANGKTHKKLLVYKKTADKANLYMLYFLKNTNLLF